MVKHSRQSTFARKFAVISVLFASHLSLVFSNAAVSEVPQTKMDCSKLCGNTSIPYPFYLKPCDGHSEFGLECLKNSTLIIKLSDHRYKVLNISPDGIIIDDLRSSCFKNIPNFTIQGMRNYAISTSNTIQLSGCRNVTDCPLNCNSPALSDEQCTFDKTCCYPLVNYTLWPPGNSNFTLFSRMQCVSFTSWVILSTTPHYQEEFGLKLEWGLMGNCKTFKCAANASCVTATDIKEGVRCACNDGYKGDGFVEGTGCNREFPENYNKGKSKLVPPLLGSIGAAALIAALYAVVICRCSRENCFLGYTKTEENLAAKEALEQVIFDYEVLRNATADFDGRNLLGKGGFGEVYKGTLGDGRVIAVKKLSERQTTKAMAEFLTEVKLMSSVRHP